MSALARGTGFRLAVAVTLAALCSLTEGVGILLMIPALQIAGVDVAGQGNLGRYAGFIDAALRRVHLAPTIGLLLLALLGLLSARTLIVKLQSFAGAGVLARMQLYLREQLHRAILETEWSFLCRLKSTDLVHVLTREVDRTGAATVYTLLLAGDLLATAIYLGVASILSLGVTLAVLGAGLLLTTVLWDKTRAIRGAGRAISEKNQLLYAAIIDHVQNLKAGKAYNAEPRERELFAELNSQASATALDSARRQALSSGIFEIGSYIILCAAIYLSIRLLAVGPAGILILLLVFARLMPRLVDAHAHWMGIVNQLPGYDAVVELEARCRAAARPGESRVAVAPMRAGLELRNISFAYPGTPAPVLDDVTLSLEAGQTVALVGPSGSGKSTLADIVIGLLAPDRGMLCVDGIALTEAALASWRAQIGYVSQDMVMFHDSLRANLKWARGDATEDEMWHALTTAAADDIVRRLPEGLDTRVGDRGTTLSHGERQRLAIARALLRKPALLVLDEATNSLDVDNESRVLDAIEKLHGAMTILVIAHRQSTIKRADTVYLCDRGRVTRVAATEARAFEDDPQAQSLPMTVVKPLVGYA